MSFITDLFGGGDDEKVVAPPQPRVTGLSTPGFGISTTGPASASQVSLTRTPGVQSLVSGLGAGRTAAETGLTGLLERTAPGVSALRASRLQGVESARSRAISNLRENLARRGVAGSSFGGDVLTRADLEFQQEADRVRAETGLQEIGLQSELINQRLNTQLQTIQAELDQFNREAALAGNIGAQEIQAATANAALAAETAQFNAQLEAQQAAGIGQALGTVAGGLAGFALGGPQGAFLGAQIGGGGTPGSGKTDLSKLQSPLS